MASLPYPLNRQYYHVRVEGVSARIVCVLTHPPPTDCRSYIEINMTHTLSYELEVSDEPSEEN